jgi:hypothetical protein
LAREAEDDVMKFKLLIALVLCTIPALAQAQVPYNCPGCVLGLYDQPQMLTNYGTVTPMVQKDIYIGFKPGPELPGLVVIELSVSGMRQAEDGILLLNVEGVTSPLPNVVLGSLLAPADTSAASVQTGGIDIAWQRCVAAPASLVKVTFVTMAPISNKVFRVMHRFPPSNPLYGLAGPAVVGCDAPNYSAWRVQGGCYIANWDGTTPVNCQVNDVPVAASPATWGTVKGMYR